MAPRSANSLINGVVRGDQIVSVPAITCFAPGTAEHIVEAHNQRMLAELGPLAYNLGSRWSGGQGNPRHLFWSFVPDGVFIPSGVGEPGAVSELFSRMDTLFSGNRALWISKFQESFDRWSALTGITYTFVDNGVDDWDDGSGWGTAGNGTTRGDVRIGMKPIDGGSNVLAYNNFPPGGDMVLDRSENWASASNNFRFLRNILLHEHGHGIGMFHVCPITQTKLMEPFLATNFDGPQHDDVRGAQRHYGDPFEPDNTFAEANDLGMLVSGNTLTVGTVPAPSLGTNTALLSIDGDAVQDWFTFNIAAAGDLTITVTPKGHNYDSSSQLGNGSCDSGNFINSLSVANLRFELIDADGSTVLVTVANEPVGVAEVLDYAATIPGDYYIRVLEGNQPGESPTQSQLYELTVHYFSCVSDVSCDEGLFCNGEETCDSGNCLAAAGACPGVDCSEATQECVALPAQAVFDDPKNRYLTFSPNPGTGMTGYRLDLIASFAYPGSVGTVGWVGTPVEQGCPGNCSGIFVSRVVDEASAHFSDSWPAVLHLGDCEVIPASAYELRGMLQGANPGDPQSYSQPLEVGTVPPPLPREWADVAGAFLFGVWAGPDGVTNFNDVSAALQAFQGLASAPPIVWVDVHSEVPNYVANFADVFEIIRAFQGIPYPFSDPALCP